MNKTPNKSITKNAPPSPGRRGAGGEVEKAKRGRPKATGEERLYCFKLRRGRSPAEDSLIDRLDQLTRNGQRSRFIRRVLTTGEIDPILEREFTHETERTASALTDLASFWDDDED